ncbi:hypothetical protein EYR36_007454 [Pleurotus pulmonarius]|nr:hypothetical protein EYR36_007454 [Pleurotus pulmonarius]
MSLVLVLVILNNLRAPFLIVRSLRDTSPDVVLTAPPDPQRLNHGHFNAIHNVLYNVLLNVLHADLITGLDNVLDILSGFIAVLNPNPVPFAVPRVHHVHLRDILRHGHNDSINHPDLHAIFHALFTAPLVSSILPAHFAPDISPTYIPASVLGTTRASDDLPAPDIGATTAIPAPLLRTTSPLLRASSPVNVFPPSLTSSDTPQPPPITFSSTVFITSTNADGQASIIAPSQVTQIVTITNSDGVTLTSTTIGLNPTLGTDSRDHVGSAFFSNTGAVAGVFVLVGLAAASILLFVIFAVRRRRRTQRIEHDTAVSATLAAAGYGRSPIVDDDDDGPDNNNEKTSNLPHSANSRSGSQLTHGNRNSTMNSLTNSGFYRDDGGGGGGLDGGGSSSGHAILGLPNAITTAFAVGGGAAAITGAGSSSSSGGGQRQSRSSTGYYDSPSSLENAGSAPPPSAYPFPPPPQPSHNPDPFNPYAEYHRASNTSLPGGVDPAIAGVFARSGSASPPPPPAGAAYFYSPHPQSQSPSTTYTHPTSPSPSFQRDGDKQHFHTLSGSYEPLLGEYHRQNNVSGSPPVPPRNPLRTSLTKRSDSSPPVAFPVSTSVGTGTQRQSRSSTYSLSSGDDGVKIQLLPSLMRDNGGAGAEGGGKGGGAADGRTDPIVNSPNEIQELYHDNYHDGEQRSYDPYSYFHVDDVNDDDSIGTGLIRDEEDAGRPGFKLGVRNPDLNPGGSRDGSRTGSKEAL